jgi:hypothetical protein
MFPVWYPNLVVGTIPNVDQLLLCSEAWPHPSSTDLPSSAIGDGVVVRHRHAVRHIELLRCVVDPARTVFEPYYCAKRRKKLPSYHDGRVGAPATRTANCSTMRLNCAAAARSTG